LRLVEAVGECCDCSQSPRTGEQLRIAKQPSDEWLARSCRCTERHAEGVDEMDV
jgi:hypothetical protein